MAAQDHAFVAPPSVRPWRMATLAGMASYLDAAALIATASGLVLYKDTLGVDAGDIGLLLGLLTAMFAVGSMTGGRMGDLYGRRRIFTLSLFFYLVGVVLLATATNDAMLIGGVLVTGLAIGADLPVSLALINEESPPEDRGRMVSYTSALWAAGVVGASLVTILAGHLGSLGGRIGFAHLAVVAAVVLVLRARTPESREWRAARAAVETGVNDETLDPSKLRELLRGPVGRSVLATGLYLTLWSLAANTLGGFGAFLWVEVAGEPIETQALWGALALPPAALGLFLFVRAADTASRTRWFALGCVLSCLAWVFPLVLGPTAAALVLMTLTFQVSASFSGDIMNRIWSQELIPVLLRGTGQGLTLGVSRLVVAAAAVGTPLLAEANPTVLFVLVLSCSVASSLVGLLWVQRLPKLGTAPVPAPADSPFVAQPATP